MNWLHTLWFGYFYPSIKGNGPESLVELIALGIVGTYAGKWIKREVKQHQAAIKRLEEKL